MTEHDIVIVGGGLVGGALATGLAQRGFSVAVIEAASRSANRQPSYDDRTLVINAASLNILEGLGLLPAELSRMPLKHIVISRAGGLGHLTLNASDHGRDVFGAVIVARELGNVMLQALTDSSQITEFCPDRLKTFVSSSDGVRIETESGQTLKARLLIGADGNRSSVRRQAGMHCQQHDYGQSAMIFNVTPDRAPPATGWERFTSQGPLALLPQPGGRLGVVWIDRTEAIEQALCWTDEALTQRLGQRFGPALGAFSRPGQRASYPLVGQRTAWPIARRVVVVGNAANAVHPVSAQGFNLGLRDVGALIDTLDQKTDPGHGDLLEHYARIRQADQEATVRYTDTLARAFTNPSTLAGLAAGLGLAAHAGWPALNRRLVQAAMGFREPVSSLARDKTAGQPLQ
jgi:2-octaprenyl-6-methoxyphenol hydroxylase